MARLGGRLSRWYAAAFVAGLAYLVGWVFVAGFGGAVVQVDFQVYPGLEGTVVVIDGDSVGTLFRRGRQRLSGFRVGLGEHRVTLRHETLPADTFRVQAELRGAQYVVYAYPDGEWVGEEYRRRIALGRSYPD